MRRQPKGFTPVNPNELRSLSEKKEQESKKSYDSTVVTDTFAELPTLDQRPKTSALHFSYQSYQKEAQEQLKSDPDVGDDFTVSINSVNNDSFGSMHSSDRDEKEIGLLEGEDIFSEEDAGELGLELENDDEPVLTANQRRLARVTSALGRTYHWLDNVMTRAWPLAFTALILNDLGNYYAHQNTRFDTTERDVWMGWSQHPNLPTLLNHLGSDLPGETNLFWAPVLTVAVFSFAGACIGRPVQDWIVSELNIQYTWPDLMPDHPQAKKILKGVAKSAAIIWSLFAYTRLLELLIQKSIQYDHFLNAKHTCEAEDKIYDLVSRLGNYACAVCPEWDEILLKDIYTSQDCLRGLLATERTPQNILDRVSLLAKYNDLTELDFSRQNILAWSDEIFASILAVLTRPGLSLNLNLTISADSLQPFPVGKFNSISQFLRQTSTRSLDVSNQQLGPELGRRLINSLPLSVENFVAVNSALGDSVTALNQSFTGLRNLNVGTNGINDLQFQALFTEVIVANTTSLQVSGNQLGDLSLITIGTTLNRTQITRLGLSSLQQLTVNGLRPLGQGIAGSLLTNLDLSNNQLDQREIIAFSPWLKNSTLQFYNFSFNNMVASYAVKQFFAGLPVSLKSLSIVYVNLDDAGMTELAAFISNNTLESLDISQNNFSNVGWNTLIPALFQSNIVEFVARNNLLTPAHLGSFATGLRNATASALRSVDISDNSNLDDNSLIEFLDACASAGVTKLVLSNTDASDAVANKIAALLKSGYALNYLDINNSGITRAGVTTILEAAAGSQLVIFKSAHIQLTDPDLYQAAQLMLKAPHSLSYLGNQQLNQDQRINLASSTPTTQIADWDFSTVGPYGRGLAAFNQAQQFTFFNESAVASPVASLSGARAVNSTNTTNESSMNSSDRLSANAELISYVVGVSLFIFLLRSMFKPVRQFLFSRPAPVNPTAADEFNLTNNNQLTR